MGKENPVSTGKCIFFDKKMSNNAARIRLWIRLKGLQDVIETKWVEMEDLQKENYAQVNPLKKSPAMVTDTGLALFESFVIMEYVEDRYGSTCEPRMVLDTPEDRAFCNLLVRIHDIYISSPNCNQPNFSHTQGCMYLAPYETIYTPKRRTMDAETRAAKLAEIYKQLNWLEENIRGPFLTGGILTHADCTWFPTCVFMEFLLPTVFGWTLIFHEDTHFPKLTAWFKKLMGNEHFVQTRKEVLDELKKKAENKAFDPIREDIAKHSEHTWVYM